MNLKLITGLIAGIVGAFATVIFDALLHAFGKTHLEVLFIDQGIRLPKILIKTLSSNVYSFMVHFVIGALIGALFLYFVSNNSLKHLIYNSVLLSIVAWFIHGNILGNILTLPIKDTYIDNLIFGLANLIFGFVTVFFNNYLSRYLRPPSSNKG